MSLSSIQSRWVYLILAPSAVVAIGILAALYILVYESNGSTGAKPIGRDFTPTRNTSIGAQGEPTGTGIFGSCEEREDGEACGDILVEVPVGYFGEPGRPSPTIGIPYGRVHESYQAALSRSRADLADRLNMDPKSIRQVGDIELTNWPDACLGVSQPDVACAQVITPGFRLFLEANGRTYQ
jgi:hypothetical protein